MSGGSERKQFFMILVVCLVGFFILSVVGVLKFSLAPGLRSSYAGAEGASAPATCSRRAECLLRRSSPCWRPICGSKMPAPPNIRRTDTGPKS